MFPFQLAAVLRETPCLILGTSTSAPPARAFGAGLLATQDTAEQALQPCDEDLAAQGATAAHVTAKLFSLLDAQPTGHEHDAHGQKGPHAARRQPQGSQHGGPRPQLPVPGGVFGDTTTAGHGGQDVLAARQSRFLWRSTLPSMSRHSVAPAAMVLRARRWR